MEGVASKDSGQLNRLGSTKAKDLDPVWQRLLPEICSEIGEVDASFDFAFQLYFGAGPNGDYANQLKKLGKAKLWEKAYGSEPALFDAVRSQNLIKVDFLLRPRLLP